MPQSFRVRWKKAFKHSRISPGPEGWAGLIHVENADDLTALSGQADLAVCDDTTATLSLDVPEEEPSRMLDSPSMEICKFNCIVLSKMLAETESLCEAGIRKGDRIVDVWNRRFRSLARSSRHITIVDRYALTDGAGLAGFERFAKELDGSGRNAILSVYAAIAEDADEDSASNAIAHLRPSLSRGGIQEIQLYLIHDRQFRRVHDRYVRFERSVCELGEGISVLGSRDGKVFRDCSFNFKSVLPEHRDKESFLKQVCTVGSPYLL